MGCATSTAHEPAQQAPPASTRRPNSNNNSLGASNPNPNRGARDHAGGGNRLAGSNSPPSHASFAASIVGWDKDLAPMTLAQLHKQRNEFWDTRIQGRPECWTTIRAALESLQDEGEATMSAILESAEMTPLDSDRRDSCFTYDSRGFKYDIPLYCVYQPSNIIKETAPTKHNAAAVVPTSQPEQSPLILPPASHHAASTHSTTASSAEVKQFEPAASTSTAASDVGTGPKLKFKIRFSSGAADLILERGTSVTIGDLKSHIHTTHPSLTPDRLRIYYLGKCMSQDQWSLGDISMRKEMVLQCFIVPKA